MVRIKWLKSAQSDLQEIHDYISYKPERPYTFKIHLLDLLKILQIKILLFIALLFTNDCISQTNHNHLNNFQKETNHRAEFDLNSCALRVDISRMNNSTVEFESTIIDLSKTMEVSIELSHSEYLVWINIAETHSQILNANKELKFDNGCKTKLCIGRYSKEKHAKKMKQLLLNLKTECSR